MKVSFFLAIFLSVLVMSGGDLLANRDENMEQAKSFFLPKGDALAGRTAFKVIQCYVCHNVVHDPEFSGGAGFGPEFGAKQAAYELGWIANSIVSPSHTIALGVEDKGDNIPSIMGDFRERMTVKQMIDLVAYIKSLGSVDNIPEEDLEETFPEN